MGIFSAAWRYRGFILGSVKREFQFKYRNSMLGIAWTVIQPLAMITIYTVIFSRIMRARLPGTDSTFAYSIFLCAGVIAWGLFTEITARGQNVFLENANILKKLNFPRICLPVIVVITACINFSIIFGLYALFLVVTGNFPGWVFLGIFPVLVVEIIFSIGLGIILGVLNVFFRDVGQLFNIVLQFLFWGTPIVYPVNILPEGIRHIVMLNPMSALIVAYQTITLKHEWPQWGTLVPVVIAGIILCILGARLFRRRAGEMVDEL